MVKDLQENHDLEQLLERSKTKPVLIFKHSTQCPVSSQAYSEFQRFTERASDISCAVLRVIENRALSNAVAEHLGIRHESPQAILVKDGKPVWNASHGSITAESLCGAFENHGKSSGS